jgi:precorrin-4 methylase
MRSILIFSMALALAVIGAPLPSHALTVGGSVRQPLNLNNEDLSQFGTIETRTTDITRDGRYNGVFVYRAVPLRALLQAASIRKDEGGFNKTTDLAIAVRNKEGKTSVLSWGEVFYRNPGNAVVAVSATPVVPHHSQGCGQCHGEEVYQPALDKLKRKVGLPKLVLANDFYSDRSLEDIVSIEVVDLKKGSAKKPDPKPTTTKFSIIDTKGRSTEFTDLAGYRTIKLDFKEVGDGRGYHGVKHFEGVPVRDILAKVDAGQEIDKAIHITSTDGYQALFSFGEIYLSPLGERIIISQGKAAGGEKKFTLVISDDTAADRMVKTVSRVEIVSLKNQPKLYVISMGCGNPSLLTLEAVSAMGKADAFIAAEGMAKEFAAYMGDKPVLFDPMLNYEPFFRKKNPGLKPEEVKAKLEAQRVADMRKIRDALEAGKSVALLEHGDPTIYGGWQHWIEPEVAGKFEVVTGISAFNASNAMFANHKVYSGISAFDKAGGDNLLCNRGSVVLTAPASLAANEGLLKAVAASGDTMAIFMGLSELKTMTPLLKKYYPETTPAAIAYKAGYSYGSRIVQTTLKELQATAEKEGERLMGMIYIGSCLKR